MIVEIVKLTEDAFTYVLKRVICKYESCPAVKGGVTCMKG